MSNQTNFSNTNPRTPNPVQQQVGQQPGVSGIQGTPQGANPNVGDGGGQQMTLEEAMELIRQRDNDINRLKSSLDRRLNESEKQYKQRLSDLEEQNRQALTATMDEAQKKDFNLQFAQKQLDEIKKENQRLQQERDSFQQLVTVRDQMIQQGIPANVLDMTSQETLATSAWTYMFQSREELNRELDALRKQQGGQQPQFPQRPIQQTQQTFQQPVQNRQPVITNPTGQVAPQTVTFDTLKQSYESALGRRITDEEFFKLAEHGKIDLTQIR